MSNGMHAIDEYVDMLLSPAPEPAAPTVGSTPAPAPARPALAIAAAPDAAPPSAADPAPRTAAARPDPEAADSAAGQDPSRWLRLRCGDQVYALELLKIREVTLPAPLLPLRGTSPAVGGIMNLRGQVVPVVDLGLHFGGEPVEDTPETRVVILQDRHEVLGLRVSAVDDIVPVAPEGIEDARESRLAPVGDERIKGIARPGGRVMLLLDARQLMSAPLH